MFNVKISLFARTRDLEHNIDSLHDKIIEMTMVFKEAVDIYLKAVSYTHLTLPTILRV